MENNSFGIKKVIVQICRAENLCTTNEKKSKKPIKWRVWIVSGKKKLMTDFVICNEGHPYWNNEIEIKLIRGQIEPIVLIVVDFSNNHYGQIVIPINKITSKPLSNSENGSGPLSLKCGELEPSKKCSNPIGNLFYRIWATEFYEEEADNPRPNFTKRTSIFGFKGDHKFSRKQSCVETGSEYVLNHYDSQKLPKRLSIFKSSEKVNKLPEIRSKAKSLANIHGIEDNDESQSSDSDSLKEQYLPTDEVYNQVTRNFNWVRVEDVANDNCKLNFNEVDSNEIEQEKVELFSIQPDNGPITGNFTVVMEGTNFTSGLFDLTYVCIDGLEPIDATTCTKILSDTELLLSMPSVSIPGTVTIHLELLDGSRINCSKNFHYLDFAADSNLCSVLTPRTFDNQTEDMIDKLFDQYDVVIPPTINGYKPLKSELVGRSENGLESFNKYDRRKLSDYGSQGSIRSDRTSSIRKKMKKIDSTKLELNDEVEILRQEVIDLKSQLNEMESCTTIQMMALKCQLESRDTQIDDISRILCNLKMQLLEDGLTKYLELM